MNEVYRCCFTFRTVYMFVEFEGTNDAVTKACNHYARIIGGSFIYKELLTDK